MGGGARGEILARCLGRRMKRHKNNKNTIHGGIYQPPISNSNTTTNQEQATVAEGSVEVIFDKRDAWGKRRDGKKLDS